MNSPVPEVITGKHIGFGDDSIFNTLFEMKKWAVKDSTDPVILNIAKQIKTKCDTEETCLVEGIFNWVYENIKYKFDEDITGVIIPDWKFETEFFTRPGLLASVVLTGDCDDMATLISCLSIALNIPVNYKVIAWKDQKGGPDDFTHVYCENLMENTWEQPYWIPNDPVIKIFGKEQAPLKRSAVLRVDVPNTKPEFIRVV